MKYFVDTCDKFIRKFHHFYLEINKIKSTVTNSMKLKYNDKIKY